MILLDTNILIEVYRNNPLVIHQVKEIGQEQIAISDITCAELFFGARNKKELQTLQNDINKLIVLSIHSDISSLAVELVKEYSLSHKLSLPDAYIAATAIFHNIPLFTLNRKDFKFLKDLKLFEVEK
jgi:predicted nucleic acid-binding protein